MSILIDSQGSDITPDQSASQVNEDVELSPPDEVADLSNVSLSRDSMGKYLFVNDDESSLQRANTFLKVCPS